MSYKEVFKNPELEYTLSLEFSPNEFEENRGVLRGRSGLYMIGTYFDRTKFYVGESKDLEKRLAQHLNPRTKGNVKEKILESLKVYDNWEYGLISIVDDDSYLSRLFLEKHLIYHHRPKFNKEWQNKKDGYARRKYRLTCFGLGRHVTTEEWFLGDFHSVEEATEVALSDKIDRHLKIKDVMTTHIEYRVDELDEEGDFASEENLLFNTEGARLLTFIRIKEEPEW